MTTQTKHAHFLKHLWRKTFIQLLPSAVLLVAGASTTVANGSVRHGAIVHRIIALLALLLFIFAAVIFLRILTATIGRLIAHYYTTDGRASSIQFLLRL